MAPLVEQSPSGRMRLVLLPGMDGTGTQYDAFRNAIESHFTLDVIPYPLDEALGYARLEQYVLNRLPKDEPFILLGESFSGPIAIRLAARRPQGLQRLVLCATFAKLPIWVPGCLRWVPAAISPALAPRWVITAMMLGRFASRALASQLHRAISMVSPSVLRCRMQEVLRIDARHAAREISVPVLYLQATEDHVVASTAARQLSQALPSIRVEQIVAPHLLLQANPIDGAAAIERWARSHVD